MNTYKILKKTGTYSEILEAYGLSNLLNKICIEANLTDIEIALFDRESYYEVTTSEEITDEIIDKIHYFPLFKFIKQKHDSDVSDGRAYYDYPTQKQWKNEKRDALQKIYRECQSADKKEEREKRIREIERIYEQEKTIDTEFDVYSQIATPNNFPSFTKLYDNFYNNQPTFRNLLKQILNNYSLSEKLRVEKVKYVDFTKAPTALQLYNPNQGKGTNDAKADGVDGINLKSSWIAETLKISGALSDMICQLVKVGGSYDMKVFVPCYQQVNYSFKSQILPDFKKHLKGNTPIKIDVMNILLLTQNIIEHYGYLGRRRKVKDIISGLYSVYQKDLGQNKGVVNIGFIQVPNFIEISTAEENQIWIEVLKEHKKIIGCLKEENDATPGLKMYRDFLSGSNVVSFFDFSFWFASYLTNQLSNNKFIKAFTVESLNKLYNSMDNNDLKLSEIISNNGFQAIAKAIRKSTVSLQYAPKDARKYEVRYGVAQNLQTKSRSKEDLAEFVGDFIGTYNSETARKAEKEGKSFRANVREDELLAFYGLLDKYPSKLIGALLASYGFALAAKTDQNESDDESDVIQGPEE